MTLENRTNCFNKLGDTYASFVSVDPVRNHLHYPFVLEAVRASSGVTLLDMGCGDGTLCRSFASASATVHAFDISPNLIECASKAEMDVPLGITYSVAQPETYASSIRADYVTTVMVLPYSCNAANLTEFFRCAYEHLKPSGQFVSVIFNPTFTQFDTLMANRKFSKNGENVDVSFLDSTGRTAFKSTLQQFGTEIYEAAAIDAGFTKIEWFSLYPNSEAVERFGMDFWKTCIDEQPYAVVACDAGS